MRMSLTNQIKNIPKLPGVYQFFDVHGKILYIGKSINLHARVKSYFVKNASLNFAKKKMVAQVDHIETIVTNTSRECLILESNLIKKHKPKYNVLLKDDKNHIYIKITDEIVPKVIKTRQKTSSGSYFGPYFTTQQANHLLKITKKFFGHRSCHIDFRSVQWKLALTKVRNTKTPCLDYYIGRCSAPCTLKKKNLDQYTRAVTDIHHFLSGNFDAVGKRIHEKMLSYAAHLEFEKADELKTDLTLLESLKEHQIVKDLSVKNADVLHSVEKYGKIFLSRIEIRNTRITGIYNYTLEDKLEDGIQSIAHCIEQTYQNNHKKLTLILPESIPIEPAFLEDLKLQIQLPKIWEKMQILQLAYKNAFEYAYRSHLASLSVKTASKRDAIELLHLLGYQQKNTSLLFECNDISHLSGTHTVASRSVLINGKPDPKKYKKFRIKTLAAWEINDFDSMREIITRRIAEIQHTGNIPDLIIIDGGKWQLSSVMEIIKQKKKILQNITNPTEEEKIFLKNLQNLQIVSIAKKEEELFLPETSEPIRLDKESIILRMVQKVRDEAHRFAITFNRNSRSTSLKKNILEDLPGFGPKTRKKLLSHYGNIDGIIHDETLKHMLSVPQIQTLIDHGIIAEENEI